MVSFPFLWYLWPIILVTTWIANVYKIEHPDAPSSDNSGERIGSYALFLQAIVTTITSWVLPAVASLCEANSYISLPILYTAAHLLFGLCAIVSVSVRSVETATFITSLCGVSWAVMMWAPFALIGEALKRNNASYVRLSTTSNSENVEDQLNDNEMGAAGKNSETGTILGIHNVYVVAPQFLVSFFSSIIYFLLNLREKHDDAEEISIVFCLGGFSVLLAAWLSVKLWN